MRNTKTYARGTLAPLRSHLHAPYLHTPYLLAPYSHALLDSVIGITSGKVSRFHKRDKYGDLYQVVERVAE